MYLYQEDKKMPAMSVLIKPASGMCNMQCDYCFYCDEAQKREQACFGFMSEDTLKNVIRKTMLNAEGMAVYAWQGGEPTLRGLAFFQKAVEYQKHYNRRRIRIQNALQTNGLTLNEDWCRFLAQNHFLVGVSVDGTEETHDAFRHDRTGNGTYERVMKTIRLFERYEVEYNILTVVNQNIARNIEEIYREYQKQGWKYQQYIACLEPLGEGHGKKEYALTPELYGDFLIRLFDLWYTDYEEGKQPYIRMFENYIGILRGYCPEACEQRGTCGIYNVVEADGSVYPCDFYVLDEYRLGNFNTDKMADINQKREKLGFVQKSEKLHPKCLICEYFRLCRGGCQRHRDIVAGKEYYENYFCKSFRMFFESCGKRMQEIADQLKNSGRQE